MTNLSLNGPQKRGGWSIKTNALLGIIISCLPDDIIELVISCEIAKSTWTDLVHSFEGPSDTKENRIMDMKLGISKKILMMRQMKDLDEEEVSDDEEMTQVKVLIALADDELSTGKNHACNGEWINITMKKVERLNPDSKLPNFNTERILVPDSQVVNECLLLIEASADPESSS
ncbi:hypothetical protein Tco_0867912 [Tanacetum coccineum]